MIAVYIAIPFIIILMLIIVLKLYHTSHYTGSFHLDNDIEDVGDIAIPMSEMNHANDMLHSTTMPDGEGHSIPDNEEWHKDSLTGGDRGRNGQYLNEHRYQDPSQQVYAEKHHVQFGEEGDVSTFNKPVSENKFKNQGL